MNGFTGRHLVIFGCGYVGTAFALAALARGARVSALTRNPVGAAALRAKGIETVVGDLAGDEWHGRFAGGADIALNCVSGGGGGVEGYRHSYLAGMESILAWASRYSPLESLVYTSSTSVYPQDGGVTVDETAPTSPANERAAVLQATEETLRLAPTSAIRRSFVLRLAGIYGPERVHLVDQVRAGEVSGVPDSHLNLIHRDDIVSAVLGCFGAPAGLAGGTFNVVDDAPARKREVVDWLASKLGLPAPSFTGLPAGGRRTVTPDRVILNHRLKGTIPWQPRFPSFREGYSAILGG
jgi:nucleoside-diphosphate-sugar epimerase